MDPTVAANAAVALLSVRRIDPLRDSREVKRFPTDDGRNGFVRRRTIVFTGLDRASHFYLAGDICNVHRKPA